MKIIISCVAVMASVLNVAVADGNNASASISIPHVAQAPKKPCELEFAKFFIETNLTSNQGCEGMEKICDKFFKCIQQYNICMINEKGEVIKGNLASDFSKNNSIHFGVNQSLHAEGLPYCVVGGFANLIGGDSGWWYYAIFGSKFGFGPKSHLYSSPLDDMVETNDPDKSSQEFIDSTSNEFNKFLKINPTD